MKMSETIKVALIGSRQYTNKRKIKECIFDLKERFGDQLEIVSGEQPLGADGIAKKITLEFNIKYSSFPPSHFHYNQHCILPAYHYGKAYKPGNFFARNKQVAEYSDVGIAFIPKGVKSNGKRHTLKCFEKLGKWIVSCHAKDIVLRNQLALHLDETRVGTGNLDYRTFLTELARLPGEVPIMLEHLSSADEYCLARDYLFCLERALKEDDF